MEIWLCALIIQYFQYYDEEHQINEVDLLPGLPVVEEEEKDKIMADIAEDLGVEGITVKVESGKSWRTHPKT